MDDMTVLEAVEDSLESLGIGNGTPGSCRKAAWEVIRELRRRTADGCILFSRPEGEFADLGVAYAIYEDKVRDMYEQEAYYNDDLYFAAADDEYDEDDEDDEDFDDRCAVYC